ncbi:MAG TPA: hypothetical protein VJ842_12270 [Pyrinomonadaceae bacterium]|nr:hypothetical protein [Pyrinomonadaceae bacterium]
MWLATGASGGSDRGGTEAAPLRALFVHASRASHVAAIIRRQ